MKYSIIYADPPWSFKAYSAKGVEHKSAQAHYDCLNIDDLKELDVKSLAAKDCVLFLWTTFPFLPQALEIISAWGFNYKTVDLGQEKQAVGRMVYGMRILDEKQRGDLPACYQRFSAQDQFKRSADC